MKKILLLFLLPLLLSNAFAQSKWKDTDWKYRVSFMPYGRGASLSSPTPDNYFAQEYLNHAGGVFYETAFVELLFKPTAKSIIFIRPKILYSNKDYIQLYQEQERTLNNYGLSKGEQYYALSGNMMGDVSAWGASLGVGRSFKLDPFSLEPFLGVDISQWDPYSAQFLFKEKTKNYYFEENYEAKRPVIVGLMTGIKLNFRIVGIWGITVEPGYALLPFTFKYRYTMSDSKNTYIDEDQKQTLWLSKVGLNIGTYFNIRKRRENRRLPLEENSQEM